MSLESLHTCDYDIKQVSVYMCVFVTSTCDLIR